MKRISLEKAAEEFSEQNSSHPFLFELPPEKGRETVNTVQASEIYKYPAEIINQKVDLGKLGEINLRIVKPEKADNSLPVMLYLHGGGWVFCNADTHDKLIRELAVRTNSVVVFPEYSLSPEAKYPTALNQCYAVLEMLEQEVANWGGDFSKLTVAGDSVGGNMATILAILAKSKQGPKIASQLLFYPVTAADFETESYQEFAEGYYLYRDGMKWFWEQYIEDPADYQKVTATPLNASQDELTGLPPALIVTGEADVLRSEGEAYAKKLRDAGVDVTAVRIQAIVHDFVMLHPLDQTNACRTAMNLAVDWLNQQQA